MEKGFSGAQKGQKGDYDDIISLPRPVSPTRPHMPVSERAAQFSPFAALSGYGDAIKESGRLTQEKRELEVDERELLDEKLCLIRERIAEQPAAAITYFVPDKKKEGGEYVTCRGHIRRIDIYERDVVMQGGVRIPIDDIIKIEEV